MYSMYSHEKFKFKRQGSNDTVDCKISGLRRLANQVPLAAQNEEDNDQNSRWVTIDGCDYEVEEDEILKWLRIYGKKFGRLRENILFAKITPVSKKD